MTDDLERFIRLVDVQGDCWCWTGALDRAGYGRWTAGGGSNLAHRWLYELLLGKVDRGLDHLCRRRNCVNPDHLEPVSHRRNQRRSPLTIASRNAAKTACARGHEFTPENTYLKPNGSRQCRTCAAASRARHVKNRAA